MITEKDLELHAADPACYFWAETNYFAFFIPEHAIAGHLQAIFRTNLKVAFSDVRIWRGLVDKSEDALYVANHHYMPMPASLREYSLPSGLSVRAKSPRDYRVDYVGIDDTEVHFDVRGIMEPYDTADPVMDPITRKTRAGDWNFGDAYKSHFDMSARVTGEIKVRGKTYAVDCVQVMDHSWGPRTEVDLPAMMWLGASFGNDFAIHGFFPADPAVSGELKPLAHGYVTEGGRVTGLVAGSLKLTRLGYQPVAAIFAVEDETGRTFTLYGAAIAGGPWPVYPCVDVGLALMRWTLGDRVGHGLAMENSSMAYRTRHGRAARG